MTTFGIQLRALRKTKGLTQKQLAEECSIPRSRVSRLESGKFSPRKLTARDLCDLCRALGASQLSMWNLALGKSEGEVLG